MQTVFFFSPSVTPSKIFLQVLNERPSGSSAFQPLLPPLFLSFSFPLIRGFRFVCLERNTTFTVDSTGRSLFFVISTTLTFNSCFESLTFAGTSSACCFLFFPFILPVFIKRLWGFLYDFHCAFVPSSSWLWILSPDWPLLQTSDLYSFFWIPLWFDTLLPYILIYHINCIREIYMDNTSQSANHYRTSIQLEFYGELKHSGTHFH